MFVVHGLDWSIWLLVPALVASAVVFIFWRTLGVLLVASVLLAGLDWTVPPWFLVIFWIAWILWLIAFIGAVAWRLERWIFWLAAALVFVLVAALGVQLLNGGSAAAYVAELEQQIEASNAKVDAANAKADAASSTANKVREDLTVAVNDQKKVDDKQDKDIADLRAEFNKQFKSLEAKVDKDSKRITALENSMKSLETRVDKIEGGKTATRSPKDLTNKQAAAAIAKALPDWRGAIVVGEVDWDKNPADGQTFVFGQRMESSQELSEFLNGTSAGSKAARAHLEQALRGYPKSELNRALSGEGFMPVQFTERVCYFGNGRNVNGKFVRGGKVCHAAGDILWVYIASDGKVILDASIRADCANPGMTQAPKPEKPRGPHKPSPLPSTSTPAPSTSTPVPPTSTTPPSTQTTTPPAATTTQPPKTTPPPVKTTTPSPTRTKKDQSEDCMLNGGPSCPPNGGHQPPQSNPGQPTGKTTGAPSSEPPPPPAQTTAPGGSSGTVTQPPSTGTPSCDPALGCGSPHTAPPPTDIG